MDTNTIQEIEDLHQSGVYSKREVVISHGEGEFLFDNDGNRYIDCVGGHGVANVGHANPAVQEAVSQQAARLITCPELFYNPQRALLEQKLAQISGMQRVFFGNSGAEAVEGAIKFSRLLSGRRQILAAKRGFHGRTMGALAATWEKKYRAGMEPLMPGVDHFTYDDLDSFREALTPDTAAVLLEVVQGEGGVRPASAEFLQGVQQLCRENGTYLVLDEVQTGFGRTGSMFAYQRFDLDPDMVCVAKALGGGIPMGAVMLHERLGPIPKAKHGSTFGGNPLASAAGLAVIDYLEEMQLPQAAAEKGAWLMERLSRIDSPMIREVRGAGLMIGIELKQKVTPFLKKLMEQGVLALPAGLTVLRLLPPLTISQASLEKVVSAVETVLNGEE